LDLATSAPNVHLYQTDQPGKSLWHRLHWDQVVIPQLLKQHKIDTMLSILNFGPVKSPARQIVFQRNPIYFSDYYMRTASGREKLDALLRRWLTRKTMEASELVVTPTAAMRDMIRQTYPQLPPERFRVIYHGFDGEAFSRNTQALPAQAERLLERHEEGCVKLLYATHPARHKGFEVAFQAMKHLGEAGVRARLYLTIELSDWPSGIRKYLDMIDALGIGDRVVLLGRIPQESMAGVYRACDVFFFPSLCESFGFTLLEAMSAGLPVVAADTAVNREMSGNRAAYYAAQDARAAARALRRVIEHKDEAARLGRASLERVRSFDWSWQRYVSDVLRLIP
jgi:glycosyltransferase involved in cell wall biosynthesis